MRRALLALSLLAACLALPVQPALAKKHGRKKASGPAITMVSPMRTKVGANLTIRGRGFKSSKRRNTVVFRAPNGRTALVKPKRASRRKLVVQVPEALNRMLETKDGKAVPTRFKLRVLSGRKFSRFTKTRLSPLVVTGGKSSANADCDRDGVKNGADSDDDNDLLPDTKEDTLKTDVCLADTDHDGVEDGFEQESALDLNQRAVPYPGKRPFPNALDSKDANRDYDGDGLTNLQEFHAWEHAPASPPPSGLQAYYNGSDAPIFGGPYGDQPRFGGHSLPLNYSDGDQTTVAVTPGHPEYHSYLDLDNDGELTDDERDVDGDGLGNVNETGLLMDETFYPDADPDKSPKYCVYRYKPYIPIDFLQPDYLDWDTDGDGVWDGNDDQDHDDVSNVDEILPPYTSCDQPKRYPLPIGNTAIPDPLPDGTARRRNPYNPCQPYDSRTCRRYSPRG